MCSRVDTGAAPLSPAGAATLPRLGSVAIAAAIAVVTLWVQLYEFNGVNTEDSAAFLAIGKLLQRPGLMLYRDLWDTKPSGIYMYQTAVFSLLPVQVWSLRLMDCLLYLGAGLLFYQLCTVPARWPLALAATAVWLFLAHHPAFNVAGFYTEEYAAICAIAAVAAALRYWRAGGLGWVAASGMATAAAVLFKHPGVAAAVPAAGLLSGRQPLRALPLYAAAVVAPLLAVVGYFWWRGALAPFLDCQFFYLLVQQGVTGSGRVGVLARLQELGQRTWERLAPYPVLVWPMAIGSAVCLLRPDRFRVAALGWLAADLSLIALQKFYFEHYFIQVFASAVLVGAIGAAWVLQSRPSDGRAVRTARWALGAAALALVCEPLVKLIRERQPAVASAWATLRTGPDQWPQHPGSSFEASIGRYVNARTDPDDRIFIYDTGTSLAALWTAERLPASRYIFSIVPQSDVARQAEQLTELDRTRPAYIIVGGGPAFHHFTPFLLAHYTLGSVLTHGYRVEIWGRNDARRFDDGTSTDLRADSLRRGLVIPAAETAERGVAELPEARRGVWTSPVVEVPGGGGPLPLDWSPREDLAGNSTGEGLPSAVADKPGVDDPRAVLGMTTARGGWTADDSANNLTVQLGADAVSDRVVVRGSFGSSGPPEARLQLAAANADFEPLDGSWERGDDGAWTYRFAPRPVSALRVAVAADASAPFRLERVQVPAVGMGIAVRYRTGPNPDLTDTPWIVLRDEDAPRVISAQQYVQVQCDMWSRFAGHGLTLRWVQIGRLRFQLDAPPAKAPIRTAIGGLASVPRA